MTNTTDRPAGQSTITDTHLAAVMATASAGLALLTLSPLWLLLAGAVLLVGAWLWGAALLLRELFAVIHHLTNRESSNAAKEA